MIDFYAKSAAIPIPGVPKLDPRRVVDGQRSIEFLRVLPASSVGRRFEIRATVVGVYDKGKVGTVVETRNELVDADSRDVYTRAVGSGFFLGQGGWGGPGGPKTVNYPPPEGREPDVVHRTVLSKEAALLYRFDDRSVYRGIHVNVLSCRLNGDYNPLHADPEPGKKMGFGGVIMHGLFTWNSTAHALLQSLGGSDPANIKQYQARFASPVKPGQEIVTEAWRMGNRDADGFEEVRFVTKVEGKVVLSNGKALIKVVTHGSSKL